MNIALLSPPGYGSDQPKLALPALAAYLQREGAHQVAAYDLDIELSAPLLTKQALRQLIAERRSAPSAASEGATLEVLESCLELVNPAVEALKTPETLTRPRTFYNASRVVYHATQAAHTLLFSAIADAGAVEQQLREGESLGRADLYDDLVRRLERQNPRIIGISIGLRRQVFGGLKLARLLKERFPGSFVVLGGSWITLFGKGLIGTPELATLFDGLVVGEGEVALAALPEALAEDALERVPGLLRYDAARGEILESRGSVVENLEDLPLPDYSVMPLDRYICPGLILPYTVSRNCYWGHCTFCNHVNVFGTYRELSTARAIDQLEQIQREHHPAGIFFIDEALRPEVLRNLSRAITERGLRFSWRGMARIEEQLAGDLLRECTEAGLKLLLFGLESACPRVYKLMGKGKTFDPQSVLQAAHAAGVFTLVTAMMGFPTETRAEAEETLRFLADNRRIIDLAVVYPFRLEAGSPIYKRPASFKITALEEADHLTGVAEFTAATGMSRQEAFEVADTAQQALAGAYDPEAICFDPFAFLFPIEQLRALYAVKDWGGPR